MAHSLDWKTLYIIQDGEVITKMEWTGQIEIGIRCMVEEMEDIVLMILSRFQSGSDAVAVITDCSWKTDDDLTLPFVWDVMRALEVWELLEWYTEEEMKANAIKLN